MTWECPNCDRRYPDSGIGRPSDRDADKMTHCGMCGGPRNQDRLIPESELRELVERLRGRADLVEEHGGNHEREIVNQRNEWNLQMWNSMANEIEALIEGEADG